MHGIVAVGTERNHVFLVMRLVYGPFVNVVYVHSGGEAARIRASASGLLK
jgi:hypothetical protein